MQHSITTVSFSFISSSIGKILASGGADGIIKFHNYLLEYIQPIIDDDILDSPITSIHFSKDSKSLCYSAKNGFYKIYNIANSDFIFKGRLTNDYVTSIQFNNESTKVTLATTKGSIYSYPAPLFQSISFKIQLNASITFMKYSPFISETIGICTEDGAVKILDLVSGELKNNFTNYHLGAATCLAFSPVSKVFFGSCGLDGTINFFDINEKKHIKTLNVNTPLTSLAFNNEGNQIICGDTKGLVYIYDLRNSDKTKNILMENKGRIYYLEVKRSLMRKSDKGLNEPSLQLNESSTSINAKSQMMINASSANQIDTKRQPLNDKTNINNTMPKNAEINNSFNQGKANTYSYQDNKREISSVNKGNISLEKSDNNKMVVDELMPKTIEQKQFFFGSQPNQSPPLYQTQQQTLPQRKNIGEIDYDTQEYIRLCVENEYNKMKGFIHEELSTLHLDIIRQFEIHQVGIIQSLKALSSINNEKAEELQNLRKESEKLKSKFF